MPVLKISLSEEYHDKLVSEADNLGVSVQDPIRSKLFNEPCDFVPKDAVQKALSKYSSGDTFTLPQLYGDEWSLKRGFAGVFGKQFFNYVNNHCSDKITFVGMTDYGRHAQYKII